MFLSGQGKGLKLIRLLCMQSTFVGERSTCATQNITIASNVEGVLQLCTEQFLHCQLLITFVAETALEIKHRKTPILIFPLSFVWEHWYSLNMSTARMSHAGLQCEKGGGLPCASKYECNVRRMWSVCWVLLTWETVNLNVCWVLLRWETNSPCKIRMDIITFVM